MTTSINGVLSALVTPFAEDETIDVPALKRLIDRTIDDGVDGLLTGGSTGEVGALTADERLALADLTIEHTNGRVPVIAQTGATSTAEAIRLSRAAKAAGADVAMLVTPFYEPLSLGETVAYIKDVADSIDLPVMLYNIPDATGVNLDPETVRGLATDVDNIRYIKDSSADWQQALQLIHHHRDVIDTFIGWDAYIYSALAEGAAGVVAGTANVVPGELTTIARLVKQELLGEALAQWKTLYPTIDMLLSTQFIAAVKAGLDLRGEPVGAPRAPVAPLPPGRREQLQNALTELYQYA
jgi:4-hydroxy-tetrahydrodipicolinate synthase